MFCLNHPGVRTRKVCHVCGRTFCDQCLVTVGSTPTCRDCAEKKGRAWPPLMGYMLERVIRRSTPPAIELFFKP